MKKILTIIGFSLGLLITQAQVGINQDNPQATLDVVAGKADGTQVEGLLLPRISKEAAYNMAIATPQPQESNLVYVNNANYTFSPGVTDAQKATVADITEKGYYSWNGSKWVKTAGKDGAEWVYAPGTNQIELKRAKAQGDTIVYFNNGNFYRNLGKVDYDAFTFKDINGNDVKRYRFHPKGVYPNISAMTSDAFGLASAYGTGNYYYYPFNTQTNLVTPGHTTNADGGAPKDYAGFSGGIKTKGVTTTGVRNLLGILYNASTGVEDTGNGKNIITLNISAAHNGSGSRETILAGIYSSALMGAGNVDRLWGARTFVQTDALSSGNVGLIRNQQLYTYHNGSGNVRSMRGLNSYVQNKGNVTEDIYGLDILTQNLSQTAATLQRFYGINNVNIDSKDATSTNTNYVDAYGIHNRNLLYTSGLVDNQYGIYSRNVNSSTGAGLIKKQVGAYIENELNGVRNVTDMIGLSVFNRLTYNSKGNTIANNYGVKIESSKDVPSTTTITNNHGLHIEDVKDGTNNYAIYTNAGKNSFGDAVEIRNINANTSTNVADKIVVADAQGVLKTKAVENVISDGIIKGRIACAGTLTQDIAHANITATSVIMLSYEDPTNSTVITVAVGSRTAGTNFKVLFGAIPPTTSFINYTIFN